MYTLVGPLVHPWEKKYDDDENVLYAMTYELADRPKHTHAHMYFVT